MEDEEPDFCTVVQRWFDTTWVLGSSDERDRVDGDKEEDEEDGKDGEEDGDNNLFRRGDSTATFCLSVGRGIVGGTGTIDEVVNDTSGESLILFLIIGCNDLRTFII